MPEASARRRPKPSRQVHTSRDFAEDESLFGRLADRLLENPVRSGGILVVLLTTVAIVSNAVFFQSARHPSPFFVTRPERIAEPAKSTASAVPLPKSRNDAVEPALVRSQRVPVPHDAIADAIADSALITEIQQALTARGLYDDDADGKLGAKTQASIVAYQRKYGLPANGQPSTALADHMRKTAALETRPAKPAAVASAPLASDNHLRSIQAALNTIGYGPVGVDGGMNNETADAIRRFELDSGMPITGEPGPELIRKLVAIGAMKDQ